jgi:hypothetical protein
MNIKQTFKNLYSSHIKTSKIFLLAGLMGGLTACKDVIEPDMPEKTQMTNMQHSYSDEPGFSNDGFMQHLSDIGGSAFYVMDAAKIQPVLNGNGSVNQFLITSMPDCDSHDEHLNYACYIGKTTSFGNRVDDGSVDSVGVFDLGKVYEFRIDGCFYDPREDWAIHEVDEDSYNNVFKNMSDSALAQMAWDRLTEVNANQGHRQNIYDSILAGHGRWEVTHDIVPIKSKGAKVGLQHSDFGLLQGTTHIQGEPEKCENFSYCGGVESKRLPAPNENAKYKGKAYLVIEDNYYYKIDDTDRWGNGTRAMRILATDSAAATFSHGINADTLVMPFNDWYTVTIITKNNGQQMEYYCENYQSVLPETTWGLQNPINNNLSSEMVEAEIGSKFYFSEQNNNNSEISIGVSVPDYYGENTDITTGLDYVYCAPARRAAQSNNSTMPREVVMQGILGEKNTTSSTLKLGCEINFVFGGINQNQR